MQSRSLITGASRMRERALSAHRTHTHTHTQAMASEEGPGPGSYEISAHDARSWRKARAPKFGREPQRGGIIGAGAGGGLAFESFLERELMDMPAPDAYDVSLSWTAPSVIKDFGSEVRLPEYQDASYIVIIITYFLHSILYSLFCLFDWLILIIFSSNNISPKKELLLLII